MAVATAQPKHPAKYTDALLPVFARILREHAARSALDPMAGVGKIGLLRDYGFAGRIVGNEIEPEWAAQAPEWVEVHVGDAADMRWAEDGEFDAIVVSPTYANRMCLSAGTLVCTWDGFKPIEDVLIGDVVLTHRGRWKPVVWSGQTGIRPVVEVVGQGATTLRCTPEHRILTRGKCRTWNPVILGGASWTEASNSTHQYWGVPARDIPLPEGAKIPDLPSIALNDRWFWWSVGFWLADGHAYRRPRGDKWSHAYVSWCDSLDTSDYAENILCLAFGDRVKRSEKRKTLRTWRVHSQELLEWLYNHFGHTSHGKRIPGWVMSLDQSKRRALLEGWLHGDGCEVNTKERPYHRVGVSVNRPMLRGMQLIAHSLGDSTSLSHTKKAGKEVVAGREAQVRDSWSLRVIPGKTRRTHHLEGVDWYQIREVRSVGSLSVPVYDLEVSDDHSFVAEGVIVHNSDHHNARDGSRRYTYRHALGRPLHEANTGQMQWGEAYREAHRRIWAECVRVLKSGGVFVLNCKNHVRRGEIVRVSEWHADELQRQGLRLVERVRVECPGMRNGANAELRVDHEDVWVFRNAR